MTLRRLSRSKAKKNENLIFILLNYPFKILFKEVHIILDVGGYILYIY